MPKSQPPAPAAPETFDATPPEGGCYYIDPQTGRVVRIPDWSHLPQPAAPAQQPEKE
jgi:hypothetical protein